DLPPGTLALAHALGVTERQLHRSSPQSRCAIVAEIMGVVQTFPKVTHIPIDKNSLQILKGIVEKWTK
ncbi:hypothetical protein, partial [Vulcaniibacterium gelatinicum]|uniref:hypothetical protein n=1 Tax=Vulcaniibacterium gelatinicum TaxID=2598725 RepID=UPI001C6FF92C